MVNRLIDWALSSRLIVLLAAGTLAVVGYVCFLKINVEAYPDPAPAIVEVVAQWPGASAEEMERLVTIPLEVSLAGMPGLKVSYSKSLFGLTHLRNVFHYGYPYKDARQEVLNRLANLTQPLPSGVNPVISPASPIGEIYRYTLKTPKNALNQEIYTLNDIKALQDWFVEREFRRVPRIIDVTSFGGTVKRYEIQPDPERLKRFGITLGQLQNVLSNSNANVGGDFLVQGRTVKAVRLIGVIGGGKDAMETAFAMPTPEEAAAYLREEEQKRLREIRSIVITSINNVPIKIDDVVVGGPLPHQGALSTQGVVVSHQTRLGIVSQDKAMDKAGKVWRRQDEKVQGIVLMRKGEESLPSIEGVKSKVKELNEPGRLLPGVRLETYYDREDLVHLTTHTVVHNLLMGIGLVTVILMIFLSNIRTAVIVAVNIPLALLIAFAVLFFRGESANLLSIGAVDFGIIVDSAVIMTENIFRNLASGAHAELPLKERILRATREIDKALFFSTAIMVVAFIPLFTMHGAEGQLFGPMAQTYAFALGGALLMALTLTPVLCMFLLKNVKPIPDNFLVRFLKSRYLWQLSVCLKHPYVTLVIMGTLIFLTVAWPLPKMGREFMPELEEGSLWIRGIYPVNASLETVRDSVKKARLIMSSDRYPEVSAVVAQVGRPDDGTDPGLFNNVEVFVPLRPEGQWPIVERPNGERKVRTRREIVADMNDELGRKLPGIEWQFSQYIRDNVMEAISGVKGDNCVKIYGPDLDKLEELAEKTKGVLSQIKGLHDLGIYRIMGQSNLEFAVDKKKCERFGVLVSDVNNVINTAVRGNAMTQMVEGAKLFDITLRWPSNRRSDQSSILEIPVEIINNQWTAGLMASMQQTTTVGQGTAPSAQGTSLQYPSFVSQNLANQLSLVPRLRLKDLVSPVGPDGRPDAEHLTFFSGNLVGRLLPKEERRVPMKADYAYVLDMHATSFTPAIKLMDAEGKLLAESAARDSNDARLIYVPQKKETIRVVATSAKGQGSGPYSMAIYGPGGDFSRPGGSIITREQGKRFIAVKFGVREDLDLGTAVAEVKEKTANLYPAPYVAAMGGEFEQMEDGEARLMLYIPASLALIFLLLYIAFRSLLDVLVVLSNVVDLAIGGIWALYLTGTNFSMSAAVGFVSLFGVAIMDGLLLISYFNDLRSKGLPVQEAIMKGAGLRVRPVMITALTAIFGLLPAAFSTAIGAQTQRPLAIVVVGGMLTTLFLTRYLMPAFYSFYGHREPPVRSGLAH
jgi:cobalt-zinc-cadmium resistance protein CzcA